MLQQFLLHLSKNKVQTTPGQAVGTHLHRPHLLGYRCGRSTFSRASEKSENGFYSWWHLYSQRGLSTFSLLYQIQSIKAWIWAFATMQGQSREDSEYTQRGYYPRERRKPLWPSVNKESDMPLYSKSHGDRVEVKVESKVAFLNYWKRLSFRILSPNMGVTPTE